MPPLPPGGQPQVAGIARTSMILGILSVTCLGCVAGIPAVICGHIGQSRIGKSNGTLIGSGMALAGLIMGYISLALTLIAVPIIAAIAIPAFSTAQQRAQDTQELSTTHQLRVAIQSYETEYGRLPLAPKGKDATVDNGELMDVLRGIDKTANPKGIAFIEPPALSMVDKVFTDKWGYAFHIALDGDGDGKVTLDSGTVDAPIAVWSSGKDTVDEQGDGDDISSWRGISHTKH